MQHVELIIRICVGTLLGAVVGYERDVHGRPAGLRTHALVGLASATFMVVSTRFVYFQHYAREDLVAVDPSRIAASVVAGIGFLAGGAILRTGISVQGLTTAAALWLVAAIGLAAGGGMYVESALATVVGVGALTLLRRFEDKDGRGALRRKIAVVVAAGTSSADVLRKALVELGLQVTAMEYDKNVETARLSLALEVRAPSNISVERVVEKLESHPGVLRVRVEPL